MQTILPAKLDLVHGVRYELSNLIKDLGLDLIHRFRQREYTTTS